MPTWTPRAWAAAAAEETPRATVRSPGGVRFSAVAQPARGSKTPGTGPRSPWTTAACASQTGRARLPRGAEAEAAVRQHLGDLEADLVQVGHEEQPLRFRRRVAEGHRDVALGVDRGLRPGRQAAEDLLADRSLGAAHPGAGDERAQDLRRAGVRGSRGDRWAGGERR